ncbi:hypothetical protein DAKH74_045730 [Maudiozyma humilis]|uniref:NAD-dependent epimerase/dehydratase domain-containing protein n=1 Tax=Maudiozyma humilis TaxID=51915 RepID=A0AAV5S3X5_MAUHU|nr:hypothetical protein DAKH74_045730 [Kazachstania humilis]
MSVFVSGATGYIAQHVVSMLLEENYTVIGSARSQEKADHLMKLFGNNPKLSMVIVPDISKLDAFDEAFKQHGSEIKVVLHTASPFRFDVTEMERDLMIPARNGTLSILEAIKRFAPNSVERVVITSSFAAMKDSSKSNDKSFTFTEEIWNPDTWESCQVSGRSAYCGSKKFAEEAAWRFLTDNRDKVKFKMSTVNPVNVFGPQMFDSSITKKLNTSCEVINAIIKNGPNADIFEFNAQFVDVRDVAKAHMFAFQHNNTIDQRLLMTTGNFNTQDIVNQLNADFPQLKGWIPVGHPKNATNGTPWGASLDNSKTKAILGFEFIGFKKSVDDTAAQILRAGNI